jgi:hypothetical protein
VRDRTGVRRRELTSVSRRGPRRREGSFGVGAPCPDLDAAADRLPHEYRSAPVGSCSPASTAVTVTLGLPGRRRCSCRESPTLVCSGPLAPLLGDANSRWGVTISWFDRVRRHPVYSVSSGNAKSQGVSYEPRAHRLSAGRPRANRPSPRPSHSPVTARTRAQNARGWLGMRAIPSGSRAPLRGAIDRRSRRAPWINVVDDGVARAPTIRCARFGELAGERGFPHAVESAQGWPGEPPLGSRATETRWRAFSGHERTRDRRRRADGQPVTRCSWAGAHVSSARQALCHESRAARSQSTGPRTGAGVGAFFRGSLVSTQRRYSCWRSTSRWGAGVHIVVIRVPPS